MSHLLNPICNLAEVQHVKRGANDNWIIEAADDPANCKLVPLTLKDIESSYPRLPYSKLEDTTWLISEQLLPTFMLVLARLKPAIRMCLKCL